MDNACDISLSLALTSSLGVPIGAGSNMLAQSFLTSIFILFMFSVACLTAAFNIRLCAFYLMLRSTNLTNSEDEIPQSKSSLLAATLSIWPRFHMILTVVFGSNTLSRRGLKTRSE